jgi:prevent-host-death family protein
MWPQLKSDPSGTRRAAGPLRFPEAPLAEIGLRELTHHTARVLRRVEDGERIVLTRHACPIAVLVSVAEAENFFAVHSADMVRARIEGRAEYRDNWAVPLDELP